MNVERTMEFILNSQAKHATRMDAIDKRMGGVTKLLQQGARIMVSFQKESNDKINALIDAQSRTDAKLEELAKAQKRLAEAQEVTEKKLQRLIDFRGRRNGH